MTDRPTAGEIEERTATVEVAGKRVRGLIPYGIESRDLGGWHEVIEPTAFRNTDLSELRALIDHQGVPLGRFPQTLDIEDRDDGLHWSLDPPRSRQDVVEAIQRGDVRAGSWRMVVSRDEWRGDVRHVHEIRELRDVTVVAAEEPAYGDAATVEYRTHNDAGGAGREEATMAEQDGAAVEQRENENEDREQAEEDRSEERTTPREPAGGLRVEDRVQGAPRGLAEAFRSRGWPGERATLEWDEYEAAIRTTVGTVDFRTLAVSGSADDINRVERESAPYGYDTRYAWPAFPRVAVGRDATSVEFWQQQSRSLATATNVVRNIDAVTSKPETSSGVNVVTTPLKQVASVQTNIPNIHLEQASFRTVIEQDLRHAIDGGLDKLLLDAIATSGFQAPASDPLLVSVRKAMTVIESAGYSPSVVILRPADAEALDTLTSGITGGTNDYVFAPAQLAPRTIFGLQVRISKSIPAPAVVDAQAFGSLYMSPVTLATFEADSGTTNRSNVRLELHAAFGTERQSAAVRIAAS